MRLLLHLAIVGLVAQLSGVAHFIGDALFPHGSQVTTSCPDERDGSDCPPGCPACHACDHRQAVPAPALRIGVSPPVFASAETPSIRTTDPPSPPKASIFRPPRA